MAINEPLAAVIILPLPPPDAIAKDSGLNGANVANNPEIKPRAYNQKPPNNEMIC